MPKRSPPFQKLVHAIHHQLSGVAIVTESAMLRHRLTGSPREVDVLVVTSRDGREIRTAIECLEKRRRADVTWVEQMKCKHEHLDSTELVLVSRNGFTKEALKLSRALNIETYTPDSGCRADWTKVVGRGSLVCARHDYEVLKTWVTLPTSTPDQQVELEVGPLVKLYRPDIPVSGPLKALINFVLRQHQLASRMMDGQTHDGTATIAFTFKLEKDTFVVTTDNKHIRILSVRVELAARRSSAPIPVDSITWKGLPAASGLAETPLGKTMITVTEQSPNQMDLKVSANGKPLPTFLELDKSRLTFEVG